MKNRPTVLIIAGALVIASAQIIAHFYTLPDVVSGLMVGTGVGLLGAALLSFKKRTTA